MQWTLTEASVPESLHISCKFSKRRKHVLFSCSVILYLIVMYMPLIAGLLCWLPCTMVYRWLYTYSPIFCIEFVSKLSRQSVSPSTDHKLNWWSVDGESDWQTRCKLMVGRRWNWLSWQFTDKLDANLWSVDGEIDCRDSLLTNSMQTYGR